MTRLDHAKSDLKEEIRDLDKKIDSTKKELKIEIREQDKKIDSLQKDINQIALSVSNIEGQITQMTRPNIIPMPRHQVYDEPKEN